MSTAKKGPLTTFTCILIVGVVPAANRVQGMPASPHPYAVKQPDGTVVTVYIRGDEFFHWEEDARGYTLMRDPNGVLVYAALDAQSNLAPTAARAGIDDPAAAGLKPGILPPLEVRNQKRAQAQAMMENNDGVAVAAQPPGTGTVKNVVIMMRFANHLTRTLPSNENINTIFNNVGPHALAPTGSVRDLYLENSYGQLTLNSSVFGWVNLPQTEQFYANGNSGLGTNIWPAITAALNAADPLIDFSQFDEDGDGFVDAIAFIHSGYGAEWGGTDADGTDYTNRIWSHRWSIPQWTSAEGVSVTDYHISPGLWDTFGSAPGRIGVISHETGHFFGLPDLYDTNGGGNGISSYCMMANSWGFTGDQLNPPHFSAWCKQQLGWVTPSVLGAPGTYTAMRVETSPSIYRIGGGYPFGEYLLIENRQPYGFESTMPQGGLAIWHVDEAKGGNTDEGFPGQPGWPGNNQHYMIALLQADGLYELERGGGADAGDLYRSGGVTEISAATTPNTDAYQFGVAVPTFNRIRNVGVSGISMTFDYDVVVPGPGACCDDYTGVCNADVTYGDCNAAGGRFAEGTACNDLAPACGIFLPPPNDDCVDAIPILDGLTAFNNLGATTDGPGDCLNGDPRAGKHDIWYVYQGTCTGTLLVSLCSGTDYDSTLQIYDGSSCAPFGTQLGCSDDDCEIGGGPSELLVFSVQNQPYLLRVAGWREQAGFGWVDIQCTEGVPPPSIVWNADPLSADRTTRSLRFRVDAPVTATGSTGQSAIKVTMIDLQTPNPPNLPQYPPPDFSAFESATCTAAGEANGCARWVGKPGTFLEAQDTPTGATGRAARLQCTPYYHDWITETANGPIAVVGAEIAPSSEYSVQAYSTSCKGLETGCTNVSPLVTMFTRRSGDVEQPFNPPATSTQPDVTDIAQLVNKFKNVAGAPVKAIAQLQPNLPELNADINALDIVAVVDAVKQFAYAFSGPCACPPAVTCGPAAGSVACTTPTPCITAFGAGALCVKTCDSGTNAGDPCINNTHCPGVGATCGNGFCRDRCGRCTP